MSEITIRDDVCRLLLSCLCHLKSFERCERCSVLGVWRSASPDLNLVS